VNTTLGTNKNYLKFLQNLQPKVSMLTPEHYTWN